MQEFCGLILRYLIEIESTKMPYFPLFLDISEKKFLVIGAGKIALAKVETLLDFACDVTVLCGGEFIQKSDEKIVKNIRNLPVKIIEEDYNDGHLDNFDVIISATDDQKFNHKISSAAKLKQKLINIVDSASESSFIFGAYLKQGNVTISISTSGASPVLGRTIKEKISATLPANLDLFGEFAEKNRESIKKNLPDLQARRLFWKEIIDGAVGFEIAAGNVAKAQEIFEQKLSAAKNDKNPAVYFIGAGPGDPELITLKAVKYLSKADIVLYDRLVAKDVLAYARKDALKINVGKTKDFHRYTQNEINQMIRKYALEGNIVARLKGGDPAIFAHLGEEIAAISDLNIPYQIIPGISSASGASAYVGIPLTSREFGKAVRFLTIYKENLVDDSYWQKLAGTTDTLVFYMSSHNLKTISEKLVEFGHDAKTPLVVIEQATTPFQKSYFSTLENFVKDFGDKKFLSPSIAIMGELASKERQFAWLKEASEGGLFFEKLDKNA